MTPAGHNFRLGRDSSRLPYLHGRFTGPGISVVYQPKDPDSVSLLLDTGASIHVAGALWRTRLNVLPGVGISVRAVGGGASASLGQSTLLVDFAEATGGLLTEHGLFGTRSVIFTAATIATVCDETFFCPPRLDAFMAHVAPARVNPVKSPGPAPAGARPSRERAKPKGQPKDRLPWHFPPLRSHGVVAGRSGFTNLDALVRAPLFLHGVKDFVVPVGYGPLGESFRLAATTRRKTMKSKDSGSFALSVSRRVGECRYMDCTRKFYEGPGKIKYGPVFVESKTWLLRVRFFQENSAERPVEGLKWLRSFVCRATRQDLLEVHCDSDTTWKTPWRGQGLNSAVVDAHVNSVESPISITRCPPGTQSPNLTTERGQKRFPMPNNLRLHCGQLGMECRGDMPFSAKGQLDHHPMPQSGDPF